jgi:hypothetical protein
LVSASIFLSASLGPVCLGGVMLKGRSGLARAEWAAAIVADDEAIVPAKMDPLAVDVGGWGWA